MTITMTPDKTALRRRLRALRLRLAEKTPDAGAQAARLAPLDRLPSFGIFSGYIAVGGEIDAMPLMRRLIANGGRPALPYAAAKDAALIVRGWNTSMLLQPDALGVPSPPAFSPEVAPRLVVAPLLAFDRQGGRLGQGAGHYDRTLANLRAGRRVFVLGLAYAGQEVDEIPMEPHDQRLDAILTEAGYIEVRKTGLTHALRFLRGCGRPVWPRGPGGPPAGPAAALLGLEFVIVKAENAAAGIGITEATARELFDAGADCLTLGNHSWDQKEALTYIVREPRLIRPLNYSAFSAAPGRGAQLFETQGGKRIPW